MLKVKSLQNLYYNVDIILHFSLKYTYNMYIDILIPCTQTLHLRQNFKPNSPDF